MLSASHNGLATRILDRADLRLNDQMIEAIVAADHADDVNLATSAIAMPLSNAVCTICHLPSARPWRQDL